MLYKMTWNITLKDLKVFQNTETARAMLAFFPEWWQENKILKICFLIGLFIWKNDKFLLDDFYEQIVITAHM